LSDEVSKIEKPDLNKWTSELENKIRGLIPDHNNEINDLKNRLDSSEKILAEI
jgi:arsenate reductase-like glutaredoxin family protein